ncbi:TPA: transposase [Vibrio cholerae]|nr:TnsA endonuclease N-terminal domain-containing protein [Vibrio cholerae]HAS3594362.1 transposase [Vibrio cholerae]HBH7893911.1 TnsA endonuclease N-terminal domain-containing protein [Vibrio vulnificus]
MSFKNTVVPFGTYRGARLRLKSAPQPSVMRAREPVRPTAGKVVGFLPSVKNKRQVAWESQLEKKACLLFEFSTIVTSYREQPITISFPSGGCIRKYTPDFELQLSTGQRIYVEVKPASKLADDDLRAKFRDIDTFWKQHGCYFIVITDEELNQPVRQSNFTFLRPYLALQCSADVIGQAKSWLSSQQTATFDELTSFIGSLSDAYALLAQGHITFDLDQPISRDSLLTIQPEESTYETCLFAYRTSPDFERCTFHDQPDIRGG